MLIKYLWCWPDDDDDDYGNSDDDDDDYGDSDDGGDDYSDGDDGSVDYCDSWWWWQGDDYGDDGNDNYGDGHRVWDDGDYESWWLVVSVTEWLTAGGPYNQSVAEKVYRRFWLAGINKLARKSGCRPLT